MKLTAIILLAACLQVSARGSAQGVNISLQNASLEKVFNEIKKQTSYSFFYKADVLDNARKVSITVKNASIEDVLNICFKNQPITYTIIEKTILVKEKEKDINPNAEVGDIALPPPVDVKGRIVNENGEPVVASVMVKGTKIGTTTNANGEFQLSGIDEDAILVISGVSIERAEIALAKNSGLTLGDGLTITVKTEITTLNEVVIHKGYYTEKQKYSLGNVGQITAAEIERQPVQNPLLTLQGKIPGIEITQLTGLPGGGVTVRIQGQNSLRFNALDPLIVIDGVPYPSQLYNNGREALLQGGSPLNFINPNDIESISILKDADATSIYGSRAANGAILIITKKGKAGKPKLSVNLQHGWGKVTRRIDMMDTRQYLDMRYEAYKNDGIDLANEAIGGNNYDLKLWDTTRYTDWQKTLIGGTAQYSTLNTSFSGGTELVQYLVGGTFVKQTTVFPGNFDNKTGGLHFNLNSASSNQKFRLQFSGGYNYNRNHIPGLDLTQQAVLLEPLAPQLYNENGTLNWAPDASGRSTWNNPLAYTLSTDYIQTSRSLVSNAVLSYRILPGLDLSSSFGYNNLQSDLYQPTRLESNPPELIAQYSRNAIYGKRSMSTWIIEPQLSYSGIISKGKIDVLLGSTLQQNSSEYLDVTGSGYANDQLMKSINAATSIGIQSTSALYKYNALFGRLGYNWDKKYLINLTARRDGSSRFGSNNKFHNFWSAGVGWIFSDEKSVQKHLSFLSFGKFRATYGTTGNDQIGDYQYISTYSSAGPQIPYQNSPILTVNGIPNPNLQWEETRKWQGGIDLGFIRDRIMLGVTYAKNVSSNQLLSYRIPTVTGFTTILHNFPATIRNTSWEFTLNTVNLKGHNINWTTSVNFTVPKNKLVSFPNINLSSFASGNNGIIPGQPLGVKKVYPYAGLDPTTGIYLVYDTVGNATSIFNSGIKQNVFIDFARYYGGMSNSIRYKEFQLDFTFQLVRIFSYMDMLYDNGNGRLPGSFAYRTTPNNQPVRMLNRWQKPGDNVEIGKFTTAPAGYILWPIASDESYSYDASYIRLKNASLSWQLPNKWIQRTKLKNCLFYFRGENLMTITKYSGLDPETRSATLPPLQMWTIGVKAAL